MKKLFVFLEEVVQKLVEILVAFFLPLCIRLSAIWMSGIFDASQFRVTSAAECFEYLFGGLHRGMIVKKGRGGWIVGRLSY